MLRFEFGPEPLTLAAKYTKPRLAKPEAYALLLAEIERYAKHETAGRSVLISGSRGAGKTTLVRLAIDTARRLVPRRNTRENPATPLLVALHGPTLFAKPTVSNAAPSPSTDKTNPTPPTPNSVAEAVLVNITKALYRAYVDELSVAYARKVNEETSKLSAQEASLLKELPAALQIAFDSAPHPSLLRQYWERGGVLDSGVLRPDSGPFALVPSQGMRELVAAATARDAFRLVVGKL